MYALYEGLVLSPADVLYSPLPMYHTAAGLMVTGAAMAEGLSSVSRSVEDVTINVQANQGHLNLERNFLQASSGEIATIIMSR